MGALSLHSLLEGRRLAAFFLYAVTLLMVLLTAGCGTGTGVVLDTFGDILPGGSSQSDEAVSKYASQLPYASLDFEINGHGGLVVMAKHAGAQTYFQSSIRNVIGLRHGYLAETAGFKRNLLMTRLQYADGSSAPSAAQFPPWQRAESGNPVQYTLERQWRGADDVLHTATARATLECDKKAGAVKLPLATVALQRCDETAVWASGDETHSLLWRDPEERMLWRVQTVPWPDGPEITWRVARPWW